MALQRPAFHGYADYMATEPFSDALAAVLSDAPGQPTVIMCADRCGGAATGGWWPTRPVLLFGATVWHLGHDGSLSAHQLTPGVRRWAAGPPHYDDR